MKIKYILLFTFILFLIAFFVYQAQPEKIEPQTDQVTETVTPSHPLIILEQPQAEQTVSSPLTIEGEARGGWFFEATFPVVLTNWDGLIIAEGFATAQGEWMTEEFVPFTAELTFTADTTVSDRGSLILQKSNPSGLPENDDAYEIVVFFE
jgi:hypothetical protein